jgi:integrase
VDFVGGYIYVNRNWPVGGVEDMPKSGKPRAVPLWDQAATILARLSQREQLTDSDFVFSNQAGESMDYDRATDAFKRARAAAGLRSPRPHPGHLTFHDLRHTYGTLAATIYKDLRQVQEYMGHASITTTELYAHFIPRHDAAQQGTAGLMAMLSAQSVHPTVHRTADIHP